VEHRERLLNARERQLLEEHLVSEVASHLQEPIAATETRVEQMKLGIPARVDQAERRRAASAANEHGHALLAAGLRDHGSAALDDDDLAS